MEDWQIDLITRNLPNLLQLTECGTTVLATLQKHRIIGEDDFRKIDMCKEKAERNKTLYDILKQREGSYFVFLDILKEQVQTGAMKILESGNSRSRQNSIILTDEEFKSSSQLDAFFSNDTVVVSLDPELTLKRFRTAAAKNGLIFDNSENWHTPLTANGLQESISIYKTISVQRNIKIIPSDHLKAVIKEHKAQTPGTKLEIIEDRICWGDLTEEWQHKIRTRSVNFQGEIITLVDLCKRYDQYKKPDSSCKKPSERLIEKLEGKKLVDLIHGKKPVVICNGRAPTVPEYYVNRKIKSRKHISRKVLEITKQKKFKDIFLFTGLELYELKALVDRFGDKNCERSRNVTGKISFRAILLEEKNSVEEEFRRICSLSPKDMPVHILKCLKNGVNKNEVKELEWVKSKGSLKTLHDYLHLQQIDIDEEAFLIQAASNESMDSHCFGELPGNGKSTLMASFAKHLISQKRPKFYTQYVLISEFISELVGDQERQHKDGTPIKFRLDELPGNEAENGNGNGKNCIPTSKILAVLSETSCESVFGRDYVQAYTKHEGVQCDYIFDGLDELPDNLTELALLVIEFLRKKSNIRVWVTTRLDLLNKLEENMGIFGHTIKPFEEKDKLAMLTMYWRVNGCKENRNLETFASDCLKGLQDNHLSSNEKDITGIPLLCLLLAEVYRETALEKSSSEFNIKACGKRPKISTLEMYEKFINKRFQDSHLPYSQLESAHMELAIELLLPETVSKSFNSLESEHPLTKKQLLGVGIVHVEYWGRSEIPRFIHRSIAEFFVACSIYKLFGRIEESEKRGDSKRSAKLIKVFNLIFFGNILAVGNGESFVSLSSVTDPECTKPSYKFLNKFLNICHFFNLSLQNPLNFSTIKSVLYTYEKNNGGEEFVAEKLWQCLHASVVSNFERLADFLIYCLNQVYPKSKQKKEFCATMDESVSFKSLLFFAAKYGSEHLMRNVREFFEEWSPGLVIEQELERSHFPPHGGKVKTLLHVAVEAGNYKVTECLLNKRGYRNELGDEKYNNLFHFCLLKSNQNSKETIKSKLLIIDRLAKEDKAYFFQPHAVQFSIMCLMVKPVKLKLLFCLLEHIKKKDDETTVINEKQKTKNGEKHKYEFIRYENEWRQNILHLLPTFYGVMTPKKYHKYLLLAKRYLDLDKLLPVKDLQCQLTPVDMAVSELDLLDDTLMLFENYIKDNHIIFKAIVGQRSVDFLKRLIKKGGDWQRTLKGKSVLHVAAENYHLEAVKLFASTDKISVNMVDNEGNTPLHICLVNRSGVPVGQNGDCKKIDSPLKGCFDFNEVEHVKEMSLAQSHFHNSSALPQNIGCGQGEMEPNNQHLIITHLIEKGAKIDQPNKAGKTPLHVAVEICQGLNCFEFQTLKKVKKFNKETFTLAFKGIILNEILGSMWHPALITSFADRLIHLGASTEIEERDGTPLLHLAAKKHSMGVEYLIDNGYANPNNRNRLGKTALEYMDCDDSCQSYNCKRIKIKLGQ